jgi:hypothetical protein
MATKRFHISDILSVTTGRLLSTRRMDGVYEILNHMTGDDLFTHQLPRAMRECEPFLRRQFPVLDSPQLASAICTLEENLEHGEPDKAIACWLLTLKRGGFGVDVPEFLDVEPAPSHAHVAQDPIAELAEMANGKPVAVIAAKD